jgi:hypothetical protein
MPDSPLPPFWDPAPFEERDLDAVLSGETADIPDALRPVADTLAALRAAGAPAEFSGEATIMAEFRALAESRARGLGEAARPAGPAATLQLPALPRERPRRHAAGRHGRRRRAVAPVTRRTGALMGVAAAAVIVIAVAFAGNLVGPIKSITNQEHVSSAPPSPPGLQGTGATEPRTDSPHARRSASPSPTPSSSSSESRGICRAFYKDFMDLRAPAGWKAEFPQPKELSRQAGGSDRALGYCDPSRWPYPGMPPGNDGQDNHGYQPPGGGPGQSGQGGPGQYGQGGPGQSGQGGPGQYGQGQSGQGGPRTH